MWAGGFSFVMGILGIHGGKKSAFASVIYTLLVGWYLLAKSCSCGDGELNRLLMLDVNPHQSTRLRRHPINTEHITHHQTKPSPSIPLKISKTPPHGIHIILCPPSPLSFPSQSHPADPITRPSSRRQKSISGSTMYSSVRFFHLPAFVSPSQILPSSFPFARFPPIPPHPNPPAQSISNSPKSP
jgi:hypothetical protein